MCLLFYCNAVTGNCGTFQFLDMAWIDHESADIFMCVAKSPEATLSFVVYTFLLSVPGEQIGSHLTDFHKVWYSCIFQYSVKKIQIKLKSDRNNWYFHEDFF